MRNNLLVLTACTGCVASMTVLFSMEGMAQLQQATLWITKEVQTASVFFVPSITITQINNEYHGAIPSPTVEAKKVRILIVPGHQPSVGGAEFGGVKERDVVVDIANSLADILAQNSHYEVMVARTKDAWNPILQSYFDTHVLEIDTFEQSQKLQMANYIAQGSILPEVDQVYHNTTSSQGALQLYGINKWSNENSYDIILHLHINDYAGRRMEATGKYTGFAVYVPDHQYSNAEASKSIGEAIAARLNAYHATSTLPREDVGVVPDQELIAIGSNNTTDGAALLIEYGYIYEPQFQDPSIRSLSVADYALQTYLGLQDFFKDPMTSSYGSVSFPYDWDKVTGKKGENGPPIYALQAALHYLGYYPPKGKNFNECPISGEAGPCTRAAIIDYQKAHKLDTTGILGPETRSALFQDTERPTSSSITLR